MSPELESTPCRAAQVPLPQYEKEAHQQQQETGTVTAAATIWRRGRGWWRRRLRRAADGLRRRRRRAGRLGKERLERAVPAAGIAVHAPGILVPEPVAVAPVDGARRIGLGGDSGAILRTEDEDGGRRGTRVARAGPRKASRKRDDSVAQVTVWRTSGRAEPGPAAEREVSALLRRDL